MFPASLLRQVKMAPARLRPPSASKLLRSGSRPQLSRTAAVGTALMGQRVRLTASAVCRELYECGCGNAAVPHREDSSSCCHGSARQEYFTSPFVWGQMTGQRWNGDTPTTHSEPKNTSFHICTLRHHTCFHSNRASRSLLTRKPRNHHTVPDPQHEERRGDDVIPQGGVALT